MEITLFNRTNADISSYEPLFEKIAERTKKVLKLKKEYQLSVTFVRSRTIHTINRDYRGIDRPTDVITFAEMDDGEFFTEEEEADRGHLYLGRILGVIGTRAKRIPLMIAISVVNAFLAMLLMRIIL